MHLPWKRNVQMLEYRKNILLFLVCALEGFSLVRKKRNNQWKGVWALHTPGIGRPHLPQEEESQRCDRRFPLFPLCLQNPSYTHPHTDLWEGFLFVYKITQNKETGFSNMLTNLPQTCPKCYWTNKELHLLIGGLGGNAVQGMSQGNFLIPPLALQAKKEGNEAEIIGLA